MCHVVGVCAVNIGRAAVFDRCGDGEYFAAKSIVALAGGEHAIARETNGANARDAEFIGELYAHPIELGGIERGELARGIEGKDGADAVTAAHANINSARLGIGFEIVDRHFVGGSAKGTGHFGSEVGDGFYCGKFTGVAGIDGDERAVIFGDNQQPIMTGKHITHAVEFKSALLRIL